jgi:solute carrier family 25 (mitochondrial phosphate transporter), member 23/24/25/41
MHSSPFPTLQALFKGLAPNYLKVVPSIAIAFVTYEQVKEVLGAEIRISD